MSDEAGRDLRWAYDVRAVYEYFDRAYGPKKPGYTPTRKALHDWAHATKAQREKFLLTTVPAADKMIAAAKKTDDPDSVIAHERKSIAELKSLLRDAVADSQGEDPDLEAIFNGS